MSGADKTFNVTNTSTNGQTTNWITGRNTQDHGISHYYKDTNGNVRGRITAHMGEGTLGLALAGRNSGFGDLFLDSNGNSTFAGSVSVDGALTLTGGNATMTFSNTDQISHLQLNTPDGGSMKGGISIGGGASSTQAQAHFITMRGDGYMPGGDDGWGMANYDTSIWTSSSSSAYGSLWFGTRDTRAMKITTDQVVYMYNLYGRSVGGTNRDVYVGDGGDLGYLSSVREHKMDIKSLSDVTWLSDLNPVSFYRRNIKKDGTYGKTKDGSIEYGLIADEVEKVNKDFVFYDIDEDENKALAGVQYRQLMIPMLKKIQELSDKVEALENA